MHYTIHYSAGSCASAEYWISSTGQFGGVHAFGYNSAEREPLESKSAEYIVGGWPWQILGTIRAVAQFDS